MSDRVGRLRAAGLSWASVAAQLSNENAAVAELSIPERIALRTLLREHKFSEQQINLILELLTQVEEMRKV